MIICKKIILTILFGFLLFSCEKKESKDLYKIINAELSRSLDKEGKVLLYNDNGLIKFNFPQGECPIRAMMNTANMSFYKKHEGIDFSSFILSDEIETICNQLTLELRLEKEKLLPQIELIDDKFISDHEYGGLFTSYQVLSNPAFSSDGQFSYIYSATHCGMECGGGEIIIYKKSENGEWQLIYNYMLWIS